MLAAPGRLPTLPQLTPRRSNSRRLGFPAACSVLSLHQISGRCRRSSLLLAWKQVEWVDLRSSEADDSHLAQVSNYMQLSSISILAMAMVTKCHDLLTQSTVRRCSGAAADAAARIVFAQPKPTADGRRA